MVECSPSILQAQVQYTVQEEETERERDGIVGASDYSILMGGGELASCGTAQETEHLCSSCVGVPSETWKPILRQVPATSVLSPLGNAPSGRYEVVSHASLPPQRTQTTPEAPSPPLLF